MYKRLIILSVIILFALGGLSLLGYHAVDKWAKGLKGERRGDFAEVAEQIREDIKRKLDEFMQTEQDRPYTDYNYYYVPRYTSSEQQARRMALMRSPLGGGLENEFAYGNFQIEPDGSIITPNDDILEREGATDDNKKLYAQVEFNRSNIERNLLPVINGVTQGSFRIAINDEIDPSQKLALRTDKESKPAKDEIQESKGVKAGGSKSGQAKAFPIESLKAQGQKTQVIEQSRQVYIDNTTLNQGLQQQQEDISRTRQQRAQMETAESQEQSGPSQPQSAPTTRIDQVVNINSDVQALIQPGQSDTVQVKIEPFVPVVVGGGDPNDSIFEGQVFLIRNVQIEDRQFLQGFQLNEKKLIEEINESATQAVSARERMSFVLPQTKGEKATSVTNENGSVAYTAILDFGFGDVVLNLIETDPAWIAKQISQLRHVYFGITSIVLLAVTLALGSLWLSTRAQLRLAQKKDDFISAVSHELRTPLTSIRMYSEMLEKNWVKSKDKLAEYYGNMRQESERLSRLIENVLDFSRIQKGRKKYAFSMGDIDQCIADVVEMMRPYAAQNGFSIKTELGQLGQRAFDRDAVTQIVVNLVDNAIKYARNAKDKTITVRTRSDRRFMLLEVEDHGPGVPHRLRHKVFEQFYRSGSEATRETTGTGLGLALVKKFAQAHNGFVEIITAKPTGAIFRVALAGKNNGV
jgi:signal transduction histidine kinase